MPFTVHIKKNGRTYGTLGPYAKRVDALADAAALKRPGHTVAVMSIQRNSPALVAALAPYVIQIGESLAKNQIKAYLKLDPPGQVAFLRNRFKGNIPIRMALSSDRMAQGAAHMLNEALKSGAGDTLVTMATGAARAKVAAYSGPRTNKAKARKQRSRGKAAVRRNAAWIKHEGKLGGAGFLGKSRKAQHRLLRQAAEKWGYRSTLGSIMALERSNRIGANQKKTLKGLRRWLVAEYGGPGSFSARA